MEVSDFLLSPYDRLCEKFPMIKSIGYKRAEKSETVLILCTDKKISEDVKTLIKNDVMSYLPEIILLFELQPNIQKL